MTRPNPHSGSRSDRTRKSTVRSERKGHSRRSHLRVEQLEDRTTPTINPATPLELDGDVTTNTAPDWDQIFADGNVVPPSVSGALASAFLSDAVNSREDNTFTGGGSKDIRGIQDGPW